MPSGKQLVSTLNAEGVLSLSVREKDTGAPGDDEVIIEVGASPINPSDLGMLFAGGDLTTLSVSDNEARVEVPAAAMPAMQARVGHAMPVGNEGAGVVIEAGANAQHLVGKMVAVLGGSMYAQYRKAHAAQCLVLNEGTTAREGASCFVNPLTALGMVETMRMEGHTALVHTAAASNLGQMLQKICLADGVSLVNIVRKPEQAELLRGIGAQHVVDSSQDSFREDLVAALVASDATIAFDATGGGKLTHEILNAMERAQSQAGGEFSRYGSTRHKQVYIYGGLERSPTVLHRTYGMAWGIGGWLLPPFLEKIGTERADQLRQRVANEVTTTFASHYTAEISLEQMLQEATIRAYGRMATGEKYLVVPN